MSDHDFLPFDIEKMLMDRGLIAKNDRDTLEDLNDLLEDILLNDDEYHDACDGVDCYRRIY